jgi:toxin ParE1/3/4
MRPVLLWTPQAREDLLDIYVTIGFDNPSAAERLYTAMEEKATLLVSYPRNGSAPPGDCSGGKDVGGRRVPAALRNTPNTDDAPVEAVEIVRVVHGHRDLAGVF